MPHLSELRTLIEDSLHHQVKNLPEEGLAWKEILEYTLSTGGKRLRPILTLAVAEQLCLSSTMNQTTLLNLSLITEWCHLFSLIHDDLPALDNDDLRRGFPTLHKKYGEGVALLAGDYLFTLVYETLQDTFVLLPPIQAHALLKRVTSTLQRMLRGQHADLFLRNDTSLANAPSTSGFETIVALHEDKTGALFSLAATLPTLFLTAEKLKSSTISFWESFGSSFGMLYQLMDDYEDRDKDASSHQPNLWNTLPEETVILQAKNLYSQLLFALKNCSEGSLQTEAPTLLHELIHTLFGNFIEKLLSHKNHHMQR